MKTVKMTNGSINTNVKVNGQTVKLFTEESEAYKAAVMMAANNTEDSKAPFQVKVDLANPSGRIIDTLHGVVFTSGSAPETLVLPNDKQVEWVAVSNNKKADKNVILETKHITDYELKIKYPVAGYTAQNYNHLVELTGLSGSGWCREFNVAEQTYYKHKNEYRTMNLNTWYELVEAVEEYLKTK